MEKGTPAVGRGDGERISTTLRSCSYAKPQQFQFQANESQAQMTLKLSPFAAGLSAQLLRLVFLASLALSLERCLCGENSMMSMVPRAFGSKGPRAQTLCRVLGGIEGKQFENEGCLQASDKQLGTVVL